MNRKIKGFFSILLVAVMIVSVFAVISSGASAASLSDNEALQSTEDTQPSSGAEETQPTEPQPAPIETEPTLPKPTSPAPPQVGKVKNIVKTSFETNEIRLEWDKVDGADGYFVYYCNADKDKTFTKIADIKSNACTIKKLLHTTQYHFKVSAYVIKYDTKYEGPQTLKKTATQPGKVTGVSMKRSSNVLEFTWSRNSKATGYKIYRASGATNGKYVLYKTIKSNSTTKFSDTNVQLGKAYYYCVKAYRDLYNTSYSSPSSDIKFVAGLGAPNFSMKTQLSRVSLSWNRNKYATGYDIYYSTSKDGSYKKLDSTKNTYYNTVKLSNNKTYYFRVRPYKLNGASKTKVSGTATTKSIKVTNKAYGKTIGNTYIEISLNQQHMWYYRNGELYCHTDVVTGNKGSHDTPKGVYSVFQRSSPATLVGADYVTSVTYWLGFTSWGHGIHDSSWRSNSEYGGTTYMGNGSHGCVNTPYSAVKKIYSKAGYGTKVVIY